MPVIGTSGSTSGDGKRSVAAWPKRPRPSSTLPSKPKADGMVSLIAATAKAEHVCLFHRFDLMRHWHETERLPFKAFVSPDGLHMNDWSYACLAKALGLAIAEAVERPTTTAIGPSIAPR
jgi:acyl-CoA thioesterase-1